MNELTCRVEVFDQIDTRVVKLLKLESFNASTCASGCREGRVSVVRSVRQNGHYATNCWVLLVIVELSGQICGSCLGVA